MNNHSRILAFATESINTGSFKLGLFCEYIFQTWYQATAVAGQPHGCPTNEIF